MRRHPRGGVIVASRGKWERAVEDAIRRRAVCLARFGPQPHDWRFTVRRGERAPHRGLWVITFDQDRRAAWSLASWQERVDAVYAASSLLPPTVVRASDVLRPVPADGRGLLILPDELVR